MTVQELMMHQIAQQFNAKISKGHHVLHWENVTIEQ
jgi:hypothetical protein